MYFGQDDVWVGSEVVFVYAFEYFGYVVGHGYIPWCILLKNWFSRDEILGLLVAVNASEVNVGGLRCLGRFASTMKRFVLDMCMVRSVMGISGNLFLTMVLSSLVICVGVMWLWCVLRYWLSVAGMDWWR